MHIFLTLPAYLKGPQLLRPFFYAAIDASNLFPPPSSAAHIEE
jgi:hypothetical protein